MAIAVRCALDGRLDKSLNEGRRCVELATRRVEHANAQLLRTNALLRRIWLRLEMYETIGGRWAPRA